MFDEIQALRDRTSAILSQVLADWSQYLVNCEDESIPPIDRLATDLSAAREALTRAMRAAARLDERDVAYEDRIAEALDGGSERRVTVDIEERLSRPSGKKSDRK